MKLPALLLLAGALLTAQTPSASVEGAITDALTGLPIPEALVTFNGPGNIAPLKTDEQGRYIGRGLAAAQYQIYAVGPGYTTASLRIRLVSGQELKGIDLKLDKEAVLAGHILDQDSHPVAGARVNVRSQGFRAGRPILTSFHSVTTNNLGEFRFTGLNPGKYYLEAEPKALTVRQRPAGAPAEEAPPVIANVRTYYGNTSAFDGAAPVTLAGGQILEGFDITLLRERTVCIASSVEDASAPGGRTGVTVSELMPGSQSRVATGGVASGEEFEICGLPAGAYRLWSFSTGGGARYASQTFTLAGRSLTLPKLTVAGTVPVHGRVTVADAKPEDPVPPVGLQLDVKDRIAISGEDLRARIEATGEFLVPAALYDDYWLEASIRPVGYYVKSAAQNGRDAFREPVRAGAGDLEIVLGADGPSLSGQVVNAANRPVPNAMVLLTVAPLPQPPAPPHTLNTVTDQNGQFTLNNMPPGQYLLMAFAGLAAAEAFNPDLVRANLAKGTEIALAPGERKLQNVTVVDVSGVNRR